MWEAGDRLRFLELSVLAEDDPLGHQQRLDEMVRSHLEVDPEAETKTRTVLEHFGGGSQGVTARSGRTPLGTARRMRDARRQPS